MNSIDHAFQMQLRLIKDDLLPILKAFGNDKRLLILIELSAGARNFQELLDTTNLQKTALSNHLNQLLQVKIIEKPEYGKYQLSLDGKAFLRANYTTWQESHQNQLKKLRAIESRKFSSQFLKSFFKE